ncbi:MAG: hypothetical protein IT308_08260 [Anaerolineaceae bacterium]|nr:hypothetical protein [Anaerolineaceae bacterium]
MPPNYFLGIDVGTTNIKAVLYDERLNVVRPTAVRTAGEAGPAEGLLDAAELRRGVFAAVRECTASQERRMVAGIGICGMAEAGCLIDDRDHPLTPIYLWYEDRSRLFAQKIRQEVGHLVSSQSGLEVTHVRSLSKYAWLVAETGYSSARWIGVPELVGLWLSGVYATDATLAARTGIYDIRSGAYSGEILDYLKADRSQFPPVLGAPARLGSIRPGLGSELGLQDGIPVFIAGHDDIVAAYGVNAKPGDLVDSTGTAEGLICIVDHTPDPAELAGQGVAAAPYFSEWLYALITGVGTTGALIETVAGQLASDFDALDRNIAPALHYPEGSFQVSFTETHLPVILRNDLHGRPDQLWSAVYDTIAARFGEAADRFLRFYEAPGRLWIIGGGANSHQLCQRKSACLQLPYLRATGIDSATRGAAALAGFPLGGHPELSGPWH